jgi:hypothetical protein
MMQNCLGSHIAARAVIFAGLLTGLLFSSGEGIHLFPFPPPEVHQTLSPNAESSGKIGYQKNAQRVERNQQKYQSKTQGEQDHWSGPLCLSENIHRRTLVADLLSGGSTSFRPFRSERFAIPIRGRAPPTS